MRRFQTPGDAQPSMPARAKLRIFRGLAPGRLLVAGLLLAAALAPPALLARGAAIALRAIPGGHYVVGSGEEERVDWTSGTAFASARVRLPRIVYDRADPDFGRSGAARSLTEARALARNEAREQAALRLMQLVLGLQLDSRFTLRQSLEENQLLRDRMGGLSERFQVRSRQTGEGYVAVELMLPFHGSDGLFALLVRGENGSRPAPEPGPVDAVDELSGLVIDASELPDFRPSLELRIFSENGRMIYGPEIASRNCAVRRGMAAFYRDAELARQDPRAGARPYYLYAAGALGRARSDIYLDASDAERILGHASGRRALQRCSVVIVMPRS